MRLAIAASVTLALIGCASSPGSGPREYLDEQSAATIKVVADPLVFAQEPGGGGRDFLNIYAIDVNRMGTHRQYLAVLQWWPSAASNTTTLLLETSGRTLSLNAATEPARELGIAQPIDTAAPREARWSYFPVTKEVLAAVAQAASMRATLVAGEDRVSYALWRDGRAELAELAANVP